MIELSEIDKLIEKLLDYLKSIQNEDGSFDTMYLQPHFQPEKGWLKWQKNAPVDSASVLIPLLFLDIPKAKEIVQKGVVFLQKTSFADKIWRYAPTDEFAIPYDTDSTAQCSFVLSKCGFKIDNKRLLNSLINTENHYDLFILREKNILLPFLTRRKFRKENLNMTPFDKLGSEKDDWDFATSCNCLLYIGKNAINNRVWSEIKKNFDNLDFHTTYYDIPFSIYAYARLLGYGNHNELMPKKITIDKLYSMYNDSSLNKLLLINSLLFFGVVENLPLIETCINEIRQGKYKENAPYYSSHLRLNSDPHTKTPYTFFGNSAITCSLYLEFLHLCKKRFYNL